MLVEDFQRFRAVIAGMGKLYEREVDTALLDAYWIALRDWPLEDFERAAGHLMRTSEFMPRPAAFTALRKAGGMTAGEAWAIALEHAKGSYRAGPTVPQVERAVAAMGGWQVIARSNLDGLPFLERRFAEHFAEIESREDVREALPAITGPASTWKGRLPGPVPAPVGDLVARLRLKDA